MATHKQRRKHLRQRRRGAPSPPPPPQIAAVVEAPVERLAYTREEAAKALGISLATLDRHVVPAITTIRTEWGRRLIPASELESYLTNRSNKPRISPSRERRRGRRSGLPPDVVDRIRFAHADGHSLGAIAFQLNLDGVATAQGGRQWWPSTVRVVLSRDQA